MRATARSRGIVAQDLRQQERFESIVSTFGTGYYAGLDANSHAELARALDEIELSLRGFAYEGAGMALVTREALNPWRRPLLQAFMAEHGERYIHLLHVGAGWAFDWVPGARKIFTDLDPLLRWLAIDGMGFRDFFFTGLRRRTVVAARASSRDSYEPRAYDQGIGRCLWFVSGAEPEALIRWIAEFAPERHADLWAGVGLAAVYAGEPTDQVLERMLEAADPHAPALAQGAAFAATALERGGQRTGRHESACRLLCGMSARDAARVTDEALVDLSFAGPEPAYEQWRRRIRDAYNLTAVARPSP